MCYLIEAAVEHMMTVKTLAVVAAVNRLKHSQLVKKQVAAAAVVVAAAGARMELPVVDQINDWWSCWLMQSWSYTVVGWVELLSSWRLDY